MCLYKCGEISLKATHSVSDIWILIFIRDPIKQEQFIFGKINFQRRFHNWTGYWNCGLRKGTGFTARNFSWLSNCDSLCCTDSSGSFSVSFLKDHFFNFFLSMLPSLPQIPYIPSPLSSDWLIGLISLRKIAFWLEECFFLSELIVCAPKNTQLLQIQQLI